MCELIYLISLGLGLALFPKYLEVETWTSLPDNMIQGLTNMVWLYVPFVNTVYVIMIIGCIVAERLSHK